MTPTEALARFIVETRFESIPGKVVAAAKTSILDTIGVTLAAIPEGVGQSIIRYVREMGGSPAAAVIGAGLKTSPPWAALANGPLAHALDFDDLLLKSAKLLKFSWRQVQQTQKYYLILVFLN